MNYDSRLRRLEARRFVDGPAPMRVLRVVVDPDPAIGVVGALARVRGMENQSFERQPGESIEQLCARAEAAVGWEPELEPEL